MKRSDTILFVIALLFPVSVFAQRFEGSSNINGSVIMGFELGGALEYEALLKSNISLFGRGEILSLREMITANETDIIVNLVDYDVSIGGRYYFSEYSKFLPYVALYGFMGYQKLMNRDILPESVVYLKGDTFIYGAGAEAGVEYNFGILSLFAAFTPKYDFSQTYLYLNGIAGVKIYIN